MCKTVEFELLSISIVVIELFKRHFFGSNSMWCRAWSSTMEDTCVFKWSCSGNHSEAEVYLKGLSFLLPRVIVVKAILGGKNMIILATPTNITVMVLWSKYSSTI